MPSKSIWDGVDVFLLVVEANKGFVSFLGVLKVLFYSILFYSILF
jgi:hypothetical protein